MDPLAKRKMWKTLADFVPGRSVLLTTHSMEEADHLADRVGVLAKRVLDIGTTTHLREKHGYGYHIQLICRSAPHTPDGEIQAIQRWVEENLPGAKAEGYPYHGQLRFNVPARRPAITTPESEQEIVTAKHETEEDTTVGRLFVLLEENKGRLGLEFYSVSPSTFDEVFLSVVEKHNVGEEDNPAVKKDLKYWLRAVVKVFLPFV